MSNSRRFLIVDSAHSSISAIIHDLTCKGVKGEFKVALNGGHAFLHIDHLHLSGRITTTELIVLLNIHTPISNGFSFLDAYTSCSSFDKHRIKIMVLQDNLTSAELEDVKKYDVTLFEMSSLVEMIDNYASTHPDQKKEMINEEPIDETDEEAVMVRVADSNSNDREHFLSKKDKRRNRGGINPIQPRL